MEKATYLTISGFVLFIISLFLPAFMDVKGYETLVIALVIPFEGTPYNFVTSFHLFLLGIHNFLLIGVLAMASPLIEGKHQWLLWVLLISVLNVIGYFLIAIFENDISDVQIGFYTWLLASLFILGGLFWRRQHSRSPQTGINEG